MNKVNLETFSTYNFNKGANKLKIVIWYFVNALFVRASWNPFMGIKSVFSKTFRCKNRERASNKK